jgi:hypothetical protein
MLLKMDSFDKYGVTESNMTVGDWSEVTLAGWSLETANPRNGSHHMRHSGVASAILRWQLGAAKVTAGAAVALYMANLPTIVDRLTIFEFRDAVNAAQVNISVTTTGAIKAVRGALGGTTLGTSTLLLAAGTYNHIEAKVKIDNATGTVEVRVNGVVFLNLTGQDTQASATLTETSQIAYGTTSTGATGAVTDWDDFSIWDTAGAVNNDFIGDRGVYLLLPDSDVVAEQDWVESTGTDGFAMIDEADPNGDTDYVAAPAGAGHISEFGLTDLPSNVSIISAVRMSGLIRKTDAGAANAKQSVRSVAAVGAGADNALTTSYARYNDVFETDPNTGSAWSRNAVNAMFVRYEKTT